MNVNEKLKAMQDDWAAYQDLGTPSSGVGLLPQGRYHVEVASAELKESKTHKLMIAWDLVVLDGDHVGRHLFKNSTVDTASADNMKWLTHDLHVLGLVVNNLTKLKYHLKKAIGLHLMVNNGESSVFFNTVTTN